MNSTLYSATAPGACPAARPGGRRPPYGVHHHCHTLRALIAAAVLLAMGAPARAHPVAGATQDLNGRVLDEQSQPITGASCTLSGGVLPSQGISATTDAQGGFVFPGIAVGTYTLSCAAVGYEPVVKSDVVVTEESYPALDFLMSKEVVVKQRVEVQAKAPDVEQQGAAPPSQLNATELRTLPLIQEKFKAALPLVPGVVRTPDGRINIKGQVENEGLLLVDSAEMVDPVTGAFSIEIPIDAVQTLSVYKTTPLADYGRFSGGLTTVETKAPSSSFHWELNDFVPTPRIKNGGDIIGIASDEPRFYMTGPVISNHLNFSEAFEYDVNNQPVRGLAWPHNEIREQGFNSFSNFQYIASDHQVVTGNVDVFPLRREYADISSLIPQSASSNYGQKGVSTGCTDRYLFASGGILTSLFQYMKFDSNAYGQGTADMVITPGPNLARGVEFAWNGNFFNKYARYSDDEEVAENYQFPKRHFRGTHSMKAGIEIDRRSYAGTSVSHPVLLDRQDGTLAESINFTPAGNLHATDTEFAAFAEDRWAFRDNLSVDYGLRYSYQTVGEPAAFSPRAGLVYSPGSSGRTVFRGGIGVFYDRVPLLAGDFTQNPDRVVTLYNGQGVPLAPPVTYQNAYIEVKENGQQIVPSHNRLDSTPHNLTWNLEFDREFTPAVLLKASFLSSRTFQEFTINPLTVPGTAPTLLLTNTGVSRYDEFETSLRLRPVEQADVNVAYVHSRARGDLNTLSAIYTPFEAPVIVPNQFGPLPSNIPDRVVTWSSLKLPYEMRVSPVFDIHSGFPYSALDVFQNYVGAPDSRRFPAFASLDLNVTKDFRITFLPWVRKYKLRLSVSAFNLTNHYNPRDVYNNVTSPYFGQFAGLEHRLYDAYLDILY
ncbi:MAG TPA: carboxypeptidase regulatory-like domain-containing protein [Terriglobia bacterium]|nr:carboxypeptidase regulatory-like domain-containing protein [Terriglobia bacterium]